MNHENYYEECALAAAGQLTGRETEDLRSHLKTCSECRSRLEEYTCISEMLAAVADVQSSRPLPSSMTSLDLIIPTKEQRVFNSRRLVESLIMSSKLLLSRRRGLWLGSVAGVIVFLLIVAITFAIRRELTISIPRPPTKLERSEPSSKGTITQIPSTTIRDNEQLGKNLVAANERLDAASQRAKSYQKQLASELAREAELEQRVRALQDSNDQLVGQQSRREAELSEAKEQLDRLRSERGALQTASILDQEELASLRTKVDKLNAELEQQARVKTANAPCESLNARNLHVVDVHDTEPDGTVSRAFGRVFYVEGKCLTFYAFDLPDKALHQTFSFYVWGGKGDAKPLRKLGVFHKDDADDTRWLLAFNDPTVLTQINNVFVTMESNATVATHPKGKTILRAFLGNQAKHP